MGGVSLNVGSQAIGDSKNIDYLNKKYDIFFVMLYNIYNYTIKEEIKVDEKLPKVMYSGKVKIGEKELSCAVLDDETRILTNTAIFQAFDRPRKGKASESYRLQNVPAFINANNLKPYIEKEFENEDFSVKYVRNGREFTGYRAEILPHICDIYLSARDDGVLTENQKPLAVASDILMRSLAKIGIIALIDEATGYQFERDTKALQVLLSQYISEEFLPWVKTFPDDFYVQMFRLRGWDYKGRLKTPYAGQITNFLVYNRLPEGVLEELKRLNPILNKNGYRKHKLHQGLTKEVGYQHLSQQISTVTTMMRGFDTWEEFEPIFRKAFNVSDDEKI